MAILNRVIRILSKIEAKKRKRRISPVSENPELCSWLSANEKYRNIHKGERCFVLGNGPSLKKQDLSCLQGEILFTVNQFFRADFAKSLHSSYHFWADPFFFSQEGNSEEVHKLLQTQDCETISFFESVGFDYIIKNNIDKQIKCAFFKAAGLPIYDEVSVDFSLPVSGCATVVQYAVELAIFMGFSEIYLLGCDMTGIITTIEAKENQELEGTYSYSLSESEKKRIKNVVSNVSMESQFMGWGRMFAGYRALKEYCDNNGILLANATLGGVLDNLPRVDLDSLF